MTPAARADGEVPLTTPSRGDAWGRMVLAVGAILAASWGIGFLTGVIVRLLS